MTDYYSKNKIRRNPWVIGEVETPAGNVPKVGTRLTCHDEWGKLKVRFAIGRHLYRVEPVLYAVGNPTSESPVFVSANYKLSFDHLRCALGEINGWILVLDTQGINVWCAAGKGTFGTSEIVTRVQRTRLDQIVSHRKLIVPQLGAPGISAREVAQQSGFSVLYGPVRAEDIPMFLDSNFKTTPEMRRVRFTLRDRVAVIPVELVIWFKQTLSLAIALALLTGISRSGFSFEAILRAFILVFAGWFTGGVFVPILLPWLPGRAFSIKGLWAGVALWLVFISSTFVPKCWNASKGLPLPSSENSSSEAMPLAGPISFLGASGLELVGWGLILIAIVSFMALNFTGTSTYTSMSGVKKEMKIAIPIQLIMAIAGTLCILLGGLS